MVDMCWFLIIFLCQFQDQLESISYAPIPDGNLNYNDLLDETLKVFHVLFNLHEVQCFVSACIMNCCYFAVSLYLYLIAKTVLFWDISHAMVVRGKNMKQSYRTNLMHAFTGTKFMCIFFNRFFLCSLSLPRSCHTIGPIY